MARGWESKSVDDQIAAAEAAKESQAKPRLTEQQRAKETERQSLLLSRAQTISRLEKTTNARYRAQLELALNELEGRLNAIDLKERLSD